MFRSALHNFRLGDNLDALPPWPSLDRGLRASPDASGSLRSSRHLDIVNITSLISTHPSTIDLAMNGPVTSGLHVALGQRRERALYNNESKQRMEEAYALHARGLMALESHENDLAVTYLSQASALDPHAAAYLADLGEAFRRLGRPLEALEVQRRAVSLAPADVGIHLALARTLVQLRLCDEAIARYEGALQIDPRSIFARRELGDVLATTGRLAEALAMYSRALQLDPDDADTHCQMARAYVQSNELQRALACFRVAVRLRPDRADLHIDYCRVLIRTGSIQEALDTLRHALNLEPENVDACRYLACLLDLLNKRLEAANAWCSLGQALEREGNVEDAHVAYLKAVWRNPRCLRALVRLGRVCLELAQPQDAVSYFDAVLRLDPSHPTVHVSRGSALHLIGDTKGGWQEFAYYRNERYNRDFEQPAWNGDALNGRTILLWADQGLGDTIQFLRYVGLVIQAGGKVLIQCDRVLVPLAARTPGVEEVISFDAPLPVFDVHAPFFALPRLFYEKNIPFPRQVPYLAVPEQARVTWRERLGTSNCRTVGIVWGVQSACRGRCVPLSAFAALARVPHVRLVSLQLGPQVIELMSQVGSEVNVETLLNESSTIYDTAGLILNLDLIISVDTMVAHLAGALAKPVWVLLRQAAEYRWLLHGDTTPWYPTMRLFRQPRRGDWGAVLEEVRAALEIGD